MAHDTIPTQPIANPKTSILLPCLNEESSIGSCLEKIKIVIHRERMSAEVIVIDNGSTDKSVEIVKNMQKSFPELRLCVEGTRGYGSAYMKGISEARGSQLFMADSDDSYDFAEIPRFIAKLKDRCDLVIGNRFASPMERSAMPFLHRYIGNPLLSYILRTLFHTDVRDIHCGMRAITAKAARDLNLRTQGMEFASEMIMRATKKNLSIGELPISYKKRIGSSKLRTFSDGWRHLRFMLLYSPHALFLIPGIALFAFGIISMFALYVANPMILGITLHVHPMFISAACMMIGYQIVFFAGFARIYAATHLGEPDRLLEKLFRYITIERAGFAGITLTIIGTMLYVYVFNVWVDSGFGSLDQIKNSIVALTLIVLGVQTVSSAFMLSILGIKER